MINESGAVVGSNQNFVKQAVVAGTTSTITTTVAGMYSIGGNIYTRTTLTNQASPTTDAVTGKALNPLPIPSATQLAKMCKVAICLDGSGNLKFVQGPLVNVADFDNGIAALPLPLIPDTLCMIAHVTCKGNQSTQVAAFTPGTTAWSTTGITNTFTDAATPAGQPYTVA